MNTLLRWFTFPALLLLAALLPARAAEALPAGFQRWELMVGGVAREALVYAPASAKEQEAPVVFVFHGHGGNIGNSARTFAMNRHWPAAISVYPQGLNTPGRLTDPEGKKPGWQSGVGAEADRDLKFFDALLSRLKQDFKVDGKRIYSTGHSNGGGFTYLLWGARGDVFAAVAPSAAAAAPKGSRCGRLALSAVGLAMADEETVQIPGAIRPQKSHAVSGVAFVLEGKEPLTSSGSGPGGRRDACRSRSSG